MECCITSVAALQRQLEEVEGRRREVEEGVRREEEEVRRGEEREREQKRELGQLRDSYR